MSISSFAQLTQTDAVLIQAYLKGESEFQQVGENLQYSLVSLYQWLSIPYITEAIKHIKSLELDRAQIIAARARNFIIQKLNTALEAAAATLSQTQQQEQAHDQQESKENKPSPAANFFMKVATLISRLSTFKPADLKAATQLIAKVTESTQST